MYSYVNNYGAFWCPSDKRQRVNQTGAHSCSYSMNSMLGGLKSDASAWGESRNLSEMKAPAQVVFVFDNENLIGYPSVENSHAGFSFWKIFAGNGGYFGERHNGGDNLCFADGHAKWYKWTEDSMGCFTLPTQKISFLPEYEGN